MHSMPLKYEVHQEIAYRQERKAKDEEVRKTKKSELRYIRTVMVINITCILF